MSKVRLIARTVPVDTGAYPFTAQDLVVYCARVSAPKNQTNQETAFKRFTSFIRRKEWSPLEMVHLTIEIETTRDIARQILRHQFRFQEFSQRYAVSSSFSIRFPRVQDKKNRQKSIKTQNPFLWALFLSSQVAVMLTSVISYRLLLLSGVAKEQARCVLPEGMTKSKMYVSGTLRNWFHYVQVRSDMSTVQDEHVEIANKVRDILLEEFPGLKGYL